MPWTAAVPAPSTRRRRCCGDLICPPAGAGAGAGPSSMGLTPSGFFLSSGSSSTARSAGNQAHAFLTGGKGRIRGLEIESIVRRPRGGGPEDELELDWIGEGDGRETGGRVESNLNGNDIEKTKPIIKGVTTIYESNKKHVIGVEGKTCL